MSGNPYLKEKEPFLLESVDEDPEFYVRKDKAYLRGNFTREKIRWILECMDAANSEHPPHVV